MELSSWIYLVLFVVSAGAAALLSRMLPLGVTLGSLVAFVLSLICDLLLLELALLVLLAAAFTLVFFLFIRRTETSLEAMVGHTCTVTERIEPLTGGQVRLGEGLWAARGLAPEESYEVGATLTVVAIEGVKLICR